MISLSSTQACPELASSLPVYVESARLKRRVASEILRFKVGHPFNHFVWTVKLIIRPKNEMNKIPKDSRIDALLGANVQLLFLNSNSNSRQLVSENDEARGVKLARLTPPAPAQEPPAPAGPS